jgi:hypothetical protein
MDLLVVFFAADVLMKDRELRGCLGFVLPLFCFQSLLQDVFDDAVAERVKVSSTLPGLLQSFSTYFSGQR